MERSPLGAAQEAGLLILMGMLQAHSCSTYFQPHKMAKQTCIEEEVTSFDGGQGTKTQDDQ